MYDATALIPIRASVLRRPASKAAIRWPMVSVARQRLGAARAGELARQFDGKPRVDGGRTDGEDHRHRVDVEDVDGADRDVGPPAQAGGGQRGVDGARGQDRGDRQPVDRPGGVGQDEEGRLAARGRDRLGRQPIEGSGESLRAGRRIPGRVERPNRGPPLAHRTEQARQVDHDRPLEADRPRRTRRPTEQRRAPAELDPQVHHHALALGVDGRVRDLREGLAEVVGDRPVEAPAARRRRVVAHAPQRLVALERHRLDVEPGALGVETGEVAHDVVGRRRGGRPPGPSPPRRAIRSSYIGRAASWIGSARSAQAFASASSRIARRPGSTSSSSPGPRRPRRTVSAALNGTAPASDATATIRSRRHREGRRPEPVAVDQRADPLAIREHDRGRPVPRREEAGGPAAQRGDVRVRRATQPESLGDRCQQGGGQSPAGRGEELECLVERQRVGAVRGQERPGGQQRTRRSRRWWRRRTCRGPARDCHGPC